jgi:hypothetical protein
MVSERDNERTNNRGAEQAALVPREEDEGAVISPQKLDGMQAEARTTLRGLILCRQVTAYIGQLQTT